MTGFSTPTAVAVNVTFEPDVFLPNVQPLESGKSVCVDSATGKVGTGCEHNIAETVCKLYMIRESSDVPAECTPRVAFVTSQEYTGALGGVSGADDKCQQAAVAGGLAGTFKAWISNGADRSPSTSFTRHGYFTTVTDEIIAYGWNELTSGNLLQSANDNHLVPVYVDEFGNSIVWDGTRAWTNTLPSGHAISSAALDNCGLFFFDAPHLQGWYGSVLWSNYIWTANQMESCENTNRLYCFEQ